MSMDSQIFTKSPRNLADEDAGTMSKKKKERENRNSANSDVLHDWSQKDSWVIITLITTAGHDENKAQFDVSPNHVSVTLADGRRFSTKLYSKVEPEGCEKCQKGNKFMLKLMKHDPELYWPSLMPTESPPNKNRNHSDVSQSASNNNNNNNAGSKSHTRSSLDKIPVNDQESNISDADKSVVHIKEDRFKTDFSERVEANALIFFMYVKQISKESVQISFSKRKVLLRFSCNDSSLLASEPEWNSSTVFAYELSLLGDIVTESGTYVVSPTKLEIKMKKAKPVLWQAVSPITAAPAAVKGKSWENSGKGSTVPQPPPAPPTPLQPRKPTCQVSPSPSARGEPSFNFGSSSSSSSSSYGNGALTTYGSCETLPGFMGLENIGNTCFMNSVLQTLLNTRELRDYFLSPQNYYQKEMNKNNPLGQGGKLAVAFAVLMKVAWTNSNRSFAPTKLKAVMSLKANQFSGFAQHDAQELMVEMLDGLHEDLNRVKEKPYCAEPPELDGWSDANAAAEAWRLHKLRNDSVIDDLFKGQFRSALTCHECGKISVKFDEFCCLSVPIPKDQKVIEVTFFYKLGLQRPVRVKVRVSADAALEDLKKEIGRKVNVSPACIEMLEAYKHRVQKIFENGSSVENIVATDILLAFEVLIPEQVGGEEVMQVCVTQRLSAPPRPTRCSSCGKTGDSELRINCCQTCLSVGYCSRECQKSHEQQHLKSCQRTHEPVGAPFIVSMVKSHATYENLARAMEGYARHSVQVFQPPVTTAAHVGGSRGASASARGGAVSRPRPAGRIGSTSSCESSDEDAGQGQSENMEVEVEASCSNEHLAEGSPDQGHEDEEVFSECRTQLPAARELPHKPPVTTGVCAVPPQPERPTSQLFTIVPVNSRGQSLPNKVPLADLGNEPLDLEDRYHLAMDWKTDAFNTNDVVCFITNKEIDSAELERGSGSSASYGHSSRQSTTLQACMDLFTQPENLSEGDSWRCPRCKKPVEATKQMSLWKLPPVLIVQLKRFSFKYVLYSDKIDKFIKYPINGFDVGAHIAPGGGDGQSSVYDLYGVVNHMGRLLGGHYTAYARTLRENSTESEIGWRLCDDSRVTDISQDRVVNDQAYLLLYRRRDTPFILPPLPLDAPADVTPTCMAPNSNLVATDGSPQLDNAAVDVHAASPSVVKRTRSSVVHVPGAPLASAVTVSPTPSSGLANFDMPHSNLHNMRISKQDGSDTEPPRHVTMINTESSSACVNTDGLAAPPPSPLHSGNVTSTINTNDAVCGNLVSNINIDDTQPGTFVPACTTASFIPSLPVSNFAVAGVESGFGSSMASSVARPMFIAGLNADNRNLSSFPTAESCAADSSVLNNRNGVFSGTGYVLGRGSGTVESTPSDGGACLDEVTPMSVSSASQPSLSSTEEESISTAQEELD